MSRFTRIVKAKIRTTIPIPTKGGALLSTMRSSWVEYYEWFPNDPTNEYGTFTMKVKKKGKKYDWQNIKRSDAAQAVGGNATCTTDDSTGKMRWFIGKHPSLGAAYHQVVKFFTAKGYVTPARYESMLDDVAYDPKKKYIVEDKGRPKKEIATWKKFSRLKLGKYPKIGAMP
jgi:hypothetical protein